MAKAKYCATMAAFSALISMGVDARVRLPGYGVLHVTHSTRSGVFRGKPWSRLVPNARVTRSRGRRDDHGGMIDHARPA